MVDVSVTLTDGSYHEVDSSEMAFKMAGRMVFKEAARRANPVLLEPMMAVEVTTPDDYMGDVIGDLNSRRGHIQAMEEGLGGAKLVKALVPLSEVWVRWRSAVQDAGSRLVPPCSSTRTPKFPRTSPTRSSRRSEASNPLGDSPAYQQSNTVPIGGAPRRRPNSSGPNCT